MEARKSIHILITENPKAVLRLVVWISRGRVKDIELRHIATTPEEIARLDRDLVPMSKAQKLGRKRISSKIPLAVLCLKAGISRRHLNAIEHGISTRAEDIARIERALEQLIAGRQRINAVSEEVGWPTAAV